MRRPKTLLPESYADFKKWIENVEAEAKDADDVETLSDVAEIQEWLALKPMTWFEGKSLEEVQGWIADGLRPDLRAMKAESRMASACKKIVESSVSMGTPSESDLEDACQWIEGAYFRGSPKQVEWARDIAHKNHHAIVMAWKSGKKVSTDAKWWIDNRDDIKI